MRRKTLDNPVAITNLKDISDEHVRYFRDNPDKLDLISDREDFSVGKYLVVLIAAVFLVGFSKYMAEVYSDQLTQFVNSVLVDLVFEMGAALIGSVATVFFIEFQDKRQFEKNLRLRLEIERRIEALAASK